MNNLGALVIGDYLGRSFVRQTTDHQLVFLNSGRTRPMRVNPKSGKIAFRKSLSRRSRNQTGLPAHAAAPRPYGQFWMIRRSTSARFVPADAGAKDKNPMGSMLFSAPIIASLVPDCHQILRKSCQESVRKGLKA